VTALASRLERFLELQMKKVIPRGDQCGDVQPRGGKKVGSPSIIGDPSMDGFLTTYFIRRVDGLHSQTDPLHLMDPFNPRSHASRFFLLSPMLLNERSLVAPLV